MISEVSPKANNTRFSSKSPKLPEPSPRQDVIIPANDRVLLRGTLFRPKENPVQTPKGIITVHSGTGVPQGFYHRFAETVADKGYAVITYDYRGIGQSGMKSDKDNEDIRMSDWITKDIPGVIEWAKETFPEGPHFAVGHAVGGHGIAYAGSEGTYDAAALINCRGMRITKVPSLVGKLRAFSIFNIIGPVCGFLTGHIPASAWKLATEPPIGVMRQWARWARKDGYFFDDSEFDFQNRFSHATQPFLSIRIPDDYWTEESSADLITNVLTAASVVEKRQAQPARGKGVGYGGYFRAGHEKEWGELLEWFHQHHA
ncbi:alpha/beta hydrolase family protein [Corynebacterium lactis]|uniref:Esterase n=1 Tax=Corynebacterium lactis RW2-5 TaxID=1408189 RepID=A0A0K2GY75_9CORY|nr:alpha/beta fold hydrolase [Corynebacterium lactis]ALA66421.1 esterase [Corynebacterium lactis RW2-5]